MTHELTVNDSGPPRVCTTTDESSPVEITLLDFDWRKKSRPTEVHVQKEKGLPGSVLKSPLSPSNSQTISGTGNPFASQSSANFSSLGTVAGSLGSELISGATLQGPTCSNSVPASLN